MDIIEILTLKPVLIGIHLGFAIVGIDAFLWLLGEVVADAGSARRRISVALVGILSFFGSWIFGGYYYVAFYGPLVKPIIKAGNAPWAHLVAMEVKEHVFLFFIPLAITALLLASLDKETLKAYRLKTPMVILCASIAGLGLLLGAFGFIISAAARWGVI